MISILPGNEAPFHNLPGNFSLLSSITFLPGNEATLPDLSGNTFSFYWTFHYILRMRLLFLISQGFRHDIILLTYHTVCFIQIFSCTDLFFYYSQESCIRGSPFYQGIDLCKISSKFSPVFSTNFNLNFVTLSTRLVNSSRRRSVNMSYNSQLPYRLK